MGPAGAVELQLTLRIGESDVYLRTALSGGPKWTYSASEKKLRSACTLRAGSRGIIQAACSLRIWPTVSTVKQKKSNCKMIGRKKAALWSRPQPEHRNHAGTAPISTSRHCRPQCRLTLHRICIRRNAAWLRLQSVSCFLPRWPASRHTP